MSAMMDVYKTAQLYTKPHLYNIKKSLDVQLATTERQMHV